MVDTNINISPFTEMEEVLERLESDCKKMAQVKDILKSMGLGEDDLVGKGSQKALPLYPLTVWSRILVARGAPGGFTNAARTIALLGARHGLDEEEVIYKRLRPLLPSDGQLRKEKQAGLRLPSYASAAGPPIAPLRAASPSNPFVTALPTSSFWTAAPIAPLGATLTSAPLMATSMIGPPTTITSAVPPATATMVGGKTSGALSTPTEEEFKDFKITFIADSLDADDKWPQDTDRPRGREGRDRSRSPDEGRTQRRRSRSPREGRPNENRRGTRGGETDDRSPRRGRSDRQRRSPRRRETSDRSRERETRRRDRPQEEWKTDEIPGLYEKRRREQPAEVAKLQKQRSSLQEKWRGKCNGKLAKKMKAVDKARQELYFVTHLQTDLEREHFIRSADGKVYARKALKKYQVVGERPLGFEITKSEAEAHRADDRRILNAPPGSNATGLLDVENAVISGWAALFGRARDPRDADVKIIYDKAAKKYTYVMTKDVTDPSHAIKMFFVGKPAAKQCADGSMCDHNKSPSRVCGFSHGTTAKPSEDDDGDSSASQSPQPLEPEELDKKIGPIGVLPD